MHHLFRRTIRSRENLDRLEDVVLPDNLTRSTCAHADRSVINGYELLLKYLCHDCDATMMCACYDDLGRYVRPHQAIMYKDPATGARLPLTDPSVPGLCHACRGERAPSFPRIAHRREATVIHRYYWRELWRGRDQRFLAWCRSQGLPFPDKPNGKSFDEYRTQFGDTYAAIEQEVFAELRTLHETAPIYDTTEPSSGAILSACRVNVRDIRACYVKPTVDRVLVLPENGTDPDAAVGVGVEDFVAAQLKADGRQVMFCESRPLHALFGVMMWLWVQDINDPQSQAQVLEDGTELRGMSKASFGRCCRQTLDWKVTV